MIESRWRSLWRTEEILRDRGFEAKVQFPGYIEIKNSDHVYAPCNAGHWLHQHKDARGWTRLDVLDERDAEKVADNIVAHLSATKKSV